MAQSCTPTKKTWIFQGTQETYRLYDSLCDGIKGACWLVTNHSSEIQTGHTALIWKAGKMSGIYAIGRIASNPAMMPDLPELIPYWVNEEDGRKIVKRVEVEYIQRFTLTKALKRFDLKEIPNLSDLEILKKKQGTNFKVADPQLQILSALLKEKCDPNV
jgi:hypothetical protein